MIPLEWIYLQFEKGQRISEDSLHSALGDSFAQQTLLTLNFLVAQGIVSRSTIKDHSIFAVQELDALRQLLDDSQATPPTPTVPVQETEGTLQGASFSRGPMTEALVVSAPLSMTGKLRALQASYDQLAIEEMKEAFSELLANAQREVFLSVPFLELDGLMVFVDEIKSLGNRRVAVRALTRELIAPRRVDYGYYQKLRAFSKLVDVYVSGGGDPELVEVRDYTIKIGGAGDRRLIYEGIHQKMIVVDRAQAYIGSGEIRAPSFVVNGDVGVVQSGQAAEFWADYFLLFWSEAQKVDHQFFRSAQS
jgi:phosphatidylserine/phosphatidylglycerophosphate/cardiolipin synthase-like enzyme